MKKIVKTTVALGLSVLPLITSVSMAMAQDPLTGPFNLAPGEGWENLSKISVASMVKGLLSLAMVLAALVAFGFLLYGGILWITSGGDKSKTETARNTITAALVGLVIVFGSFAIIQLVQIAFGVSILKLNFESFKFYSGS
ncbi:MAG TPA: hypothetical protein VMW41_00815 [Candidatus Bathyarchaeia archaeon]|nr:hypothetical protein [Candidatus Bathyarchaeia archaeon]